MKTKLKPGRKSVSAKFGIRPIRGGLDAAKARVAVIVAQFNAHFTEKLLEGALMTLTRHGVKPASIDVYFVPGAFEIPLVVKRVLTKRRADAVITLGMVIKGETRHFDHVVDESARGAMQAALESDVPVIHGVVSANDLKQAIDRTGGKIGNKGRDCARAAIEMANLLKKI
jgi:6,7-dimethyl-8-ribityllumazine synthase